MNRFAAILLLISCCVGCRTTGPEKEVVRKLTPEYGFVIEGPNIEMLFQQPSRTEPQPDSFWQPTPEDIQNLEADFRHYGRKVIEDWNDPWSTYARQYAGFIRENQKFIYCNFFPLDLEEERNIQNRGRFLRTFPVLIADGGPRFFGVVYDVEKRRFSDYQSNNRTPGRRQK